MKRSLAIALVCLAGQAAAQVGGDGSALRRALQIDPFAVAPYRLLVTGLKPVDRRKLVDELSRSTKFADQVVVARLELDGGSPAAARTALHTALPTLPVESRAIDAYCQLALTSGAFADAAVAAQRALERGRTPPRLVTAAIAELRQGKQKEGLALLGEARGKDPSGSSTDAALDTLLGQHLVEEGATLLRAQLDEHSGRPGGTATQWRRLADLERQLGHVDAAANALLRSLDLETSPTGRRAASQALLRQYREQKKLAELLKLLKTAQTSPRLVLRGDVETELGHASAAKASWEAAAKLDPADSDAQLHLASAAKTPADRAARYEALVATHPGELRFALDLADLRFAARDDAAGRRVLREAGARFINSPTAQDQIARRLTEHKDLEGALICRRRAAQLDPRDVDYALQLGEALATAQKRDEAVAAFNDAIVRGGGGRAAYDRAIDGLERAGYDADADQDFIAARAKWPGDVQLMRRHAASLERRASAAAKRTERLELFQRALAVWQEIKGKITRPLEAEAANYNMLRLKDSVLAEQSEKSR
jgi:predicted TPR repeat methyltransferase